MKKSTLMGFVMALAIGLPLVVSQIVRAEDKELPPGIEKQGRIPGKGQHQGWEKGKHKGWGKKLLAESEFIAKETHGKEFTNVIAGIGVREYYKKLGYMQNNAFVRKKLE